MSLFVSQLFNGLQTGSVYALVALGYSMVYGIILLLNFAHGDIIMIGAYTAFYAMTAFHLHPIFSVVLAVITSTLLGVVIEKVAYTPLRSAPRLSLLITAIGISFLLETVRSCCSAQTPRAWIRLFPATSPLDRSRSAIPQF